MIESHARLRATLLRAGIETDDLLGQDWPAACWEISQRLRAAGFDGPLIMGVTPLEQVIEMVDRWDAERGRR